ncbi:hypothetical protein X729_24865 [Mesorhizobium sp. L103C131B0]|nr:hypothetical protein X729_24865 [Mesorhizobium sp. L103C131B0]
MQRAIRIAVVDEASGHPVEKAESPVGVAKQQDAGIRG